MISDDNPGSAPGPHGAAAVLGTRQAWNRPRRDLWIFLSRSVNQYSPHRFSLQCAVFAEIADFLDIHSSCEESDEMYHTVAFRFAIWFASRQLFRLACIQHGEQANIVN